MKYIVIKADMNDADYVTKMSIISDMQIEKIKPLVEAIKNFKPSSEHDYNWPTGEISYKDDNIEVIYGNKIDSDLIHSFNEFVPEGDPNYPGIHTIESIKIMELIEELL